MQNLEKVYKRDHVATPALRGVSFNVRAGEFIAIMGPSGSGKSTLMHIMSFLDRPTSGTCCFEDKSIDEFPDDELARVRNKKMGFVFQTFNLLSRTSVFENVRLPLIYSSLKDDLAGKKVKQAIEAVGLSHRMNHFPNQLSGGEQQRAAIARALVNRPQVIFADEPTGNLDSKSGSQIMEILQGLNSRGHTIVLVTHEEYIAQTAKRILFLRDGRIIEDKILK